ncbi:MAG: histidine phosphatase family protein [Anaerolineae bacterium]
MKLLLIRHGESVANAEGRLQGQFDSPLSDEGRAQARALARRLGREEWQVAAVYASDLSRAAETAAILGRELGLPVTLDPRLREYDAGVLNGLTWPEIEARHPELWHELQHSGEWVPIPGEEGNDVFHARVAEALAAVQGAHGDGETVVLVSHGGTFSMLLLHLLGLERGRASPFSFGNTSLSIVEFRARGPVIRRLNDMCHLLP